MKIALVDDERIYLDEMQKLCLEFAAQHTIQPEIFRFSSSEDFLKSWQPGFYSIIFLDIFMKNGNGIETAQKLREGNDNSLLVFLTSSSDFMPDAFSCHAFDYILKPISYFSFSESMVRALAKVKTPEKEYITIVLKGGKKKLDVARICYVEVQDHVLIYHTLDGDFETKGTMRDTDNQFDSGICGFHDSRAFECGDLDHLAAELTRKLRSVDLIAVFLYDVHHVDGDHHRDSELGELRCEVKVSFEVGSVDDVEYCIGTFTDEVVSCNDLFKGVGGKRVNTRKVGDRYAVVLFEFSFFFFDGDTGPVSDELI